MRGKGENQGWSLLIDIATRRQEPGLGELSVSLYATGPRVLKWKGCCSQGTRRAALTHICVRGLVVHSNLAVPSAAWVIS